MELARIATLIFFLLFSDKSSELFTPKINCGKNGTCSNESTTAEKLATYPLIITEVISDDKCIPGGEPYVIETKFKYKTKKSWSLKLNGSAVTDLKGIVYENGLSALVKIDSDLYGGYGNTKVEIAISDASEEKIITKQICVGHLTAKVTVSVPQASPPYKMVDFYIKTEFPRHNISFFIDYGDGTSSTIPLLNVPLHKLSKTYYAIQDFNYTWKANNSNTFAQGNGFIRIMNPVQPVHRYKFSKGYDFYWPRSTARFFLDMHCRDRSPTDAVFKIDFGDGTITPWKKLSPFIDCVRGVSLMKYIYKRSGCFEVLIELRNLLGYCKKTLIVNIHEAVSSLSLRVQSVPHVRDVVKLVGGKNVIYLSNSAPFEIEFITTGGTCNFYSWYTMNPFSAKETKQQPTMIFTHLIGRAGFFDMEMELANSVNVMTKRIRIYLTESLAGLTLLVSDPDASGLTFFYLLVEAKGTETQFFWDFGFNATVLETNATFSPAASLPNITSIRGSENINLAKYNGLVRSYTYSSHGVYKVAASATDVFTTLKSSHTIYFSKEVCKRPAVNIILENHKNWLIFSGVTFTIMTDVAIECSNSGQVVFSWSLYKSSQKDLNAKRVAESDKKINFPDGVVTNQREITIEKGSLSPGIYIISIIVTIKHLGYSGSADQYLEIRPGPVHARIKGGSSRLLSWEKDVVLDGSSSYDPNALEGNPKSLTYKWYCGVKPGSLLFPIGRGGCFGYGPGFVENSDVIWTIPAMSLLRNAVYEITLVAGSRLLPGINGSFVQQIDLRSGTFMETTIKCKSNCKEKLDPHTRFSLMGSCYGCGWFVNYKWSLHLRNDSREIPLRWLQETRTMQDAISFVLLPNILQGYTEYLAKFAVQTPTGETGYSHYSFMLSTPPHGGFCNVTPVIGETVKTPFYIFCHDWKSESSGLHYSVTLAEKTMVLGSLTDNSKSILLSHGPLPYTTTRLPEGSPDRNFEQRLEIRIMDSYGASTQINKTVKVLPFTVKIDTNNPSVSDTPVETELESYVYGKDSTLEKVTSSGDVQGLGRFTKAIGKSLHSAKMNNADPHESRALKEKRRKKREKMREIVVNSLTGVKLTTLDSFALISCALEEMSVCEDELAKDSQDKTLSFYDYAARYMGKTVEKWKDNDPKVVQDAFGCLLEGVGNIVESAVVSRSDNAATDGKEKADYLKFVMGSFDVISNSTSLLCQSMVAEEIAKRFNRDSITVEVKRSEGDRLGSFDVSTVAGGSVRTPSGLGIFGENGTMEAVIDMKMVTLSKNPFTWDKGKKGKSMVPIVSSLDFSSNGSRIPVNSLPPGDKAIISFTNPDPTHLRKQANVRASDFLIYRLTVPRVGESVLLKASCVGGECYVFVRYHGIPSYQNYSDVFVVGDTSKASVESQFKVFPVVDSTSFNLGVARAFGHSKVETVPNSTKVTFVMEVFSTNCFYWDTIESEWKSDGCEVSNESRPDKTVCKCSHLTWFGAGLVAKPRIIDVRKEITKIKNLADYPALLVTVCVIGGLYLIAMIWARHQDKNDTLKAALIIVDGCCRTHKYRYEVTIYTGSRPGSGTTSTVCMILGGSNGESDPHCLSNYTDLLFQRGSVDSFLVTSEENLGKITWLRVWHDNTGEHASWFLSRVLVTDILKGTQTAFICHTWLGIGIEDGKIDKTFICAEGDELKDFETLFLAKTSRGFSDDHLWFSVAMRPPRSHFTRCQRVSCCLSALLCTMLANAIFYQVDTVAGNNIDLGSFSFSWNQIAIGVESALIVIPANVLIVELFRKAAPSMKYTNEEDEDADAQMEANSKTSLLTKEDRQISENVININNENKETELYSRKESAVYAMERIESSNYPFMGIFSKDTLDLIHTLNELENDANDVVHFMNSFTSKPLRGDTCRDKALVEAQNGFKPSWQYENHCKKEVDRTDPISNTLNSAALQNDNVKSSKINDDTFRVANEQGHINSIRGGMEAKKKDLLSREDVVIHIESNSLLDSSLYAKEVSKDTMDTLKYLNPKQQQEIESEAASNKSKTDLESGEDGDKKIADILEDIFQRKPKSNGGSGLLSYFELIFGDMKKRKDEVTFWPHWCFYVAWTICALSITTAAFFTLLYGLSFGRVLQEKWLVSFVISIFQDIFVQQPVKVLVIGCIFAFILKKLTDDEKLPEAELAKNNKWVKSNLPLQEKRATESKIRIPLTDSCVHKAHINRLKEIKLTDVTLEIVVYFFYIVLALLIAYGHRSPAAYGMGQNIKSMFITDKFDQITDVNGFWDWTDDTFLPSIYGEVWYNGDPTEHQGFLADYVTYLIGSPRLRQVRVLQEECKTSGMKNDVGRKKCRAVFTRSNEDKGDYSRGWTLNSSISDSITVTKNREDPWMYYSDSGLKGHSFASQRNTYPGGGYVRTLGKTKAEANTTFAYLKKNLWLDTLTRALFIEFSTYNNNGNFFCIVTLVLEFNPDGGVSPYSKVITTRLDRYNSEFSFFLAACEISFLLFTLYYMWLEFKKFRNKGFAYFRQIGSIVELFSFSVTWAAFALLIVRFGVVKWTKKKYKENTDGFTSFQYAASSDLVYGYVFAAVVVIAFLKVLKILRFNKNTSLLLKTLQYASKGLKYYSIIFSVVFSGFIQWAYLCFGRQVPGYSTVVRTCMSALNLLLGAPQFPDLQKANRIVGPIFYTLFVVVIIFVLMNMYLSITLDAFAVVRRKMAGQSNKYDILEFLFERLSACFPFVSSMKKAKSDHSDVDFQWYYEKRLQQRKGEEQEDTDIGSFLKKIDQMEDVVNNLLLSEYEDVEGLARLALKIKGKKVNLKTEDTEYEVVENIQSCMEDFSDDGDII